MLLELLRRGTAAHAGGVIGGSSHNGPSSRQLLTSEVPGGGGPAAAVRELQRQQLAPAAVRRVRVAALRCLSAVCGGEGSASAATGLAWDIAAAAAPFLAPSAAGFGGDRRGGVAPRAAGRGADADEAPLRAAAANAVLAAARVDADAVWLLLYDIARGGSGGGPSGASAAAGHLMRKGLVAPEWHTAVKGCARGMRDRDGGGWPVSAELRRDCREVAAALLPRVEALAVRWHALTPVVAPDWGLPAASS